MNINKNLLISRIKEAYKLKTDTELAKFLGVANTTLSSWKARNNIDFEKILSRCANINWNFLVYGVGPYFFNYDEQEDNSICQPKTEPLKSEIEVLRSIAEKNDQLIEILIKEITHLKLELQRVAKEESLPKDANQ